MVLDNTHSKDSGAFRWMVIPPPPWPLLLLNRRTAQFLVTNLWTSKRALWKTSWQLEETASIDSIPYTYCTTWIHLVETILFHTAVVQPLAQSATTTTPKITTTAAATTTTMPPIGGGVYTGWGRNDCGNHSTLIYEGKQASNSQNF